MFSSDFYALHKNKKIGRKLTYNQLPKGYLDKDELEALNDHLFSEMCFKLGEYTSIEEARTMKKKRDMFFHVLRSCNEAVIDVFKQFCEQHGIDIGMHVHKHVTPNYTFVGGSC